jgi:hypothetical protein
MRYVLQPFSSVLVVLKRIGVDPFSAGIVVVDFAFIDAAVIKYVASLSLCVSVAESALIVRSIFKKKLSASMEFIVGPLSVVATLGFVHLFVGIAGDPFRQHRGLFRAELGQLLHFFSHNAGKHLFSRFFGDDFVVSTGLRG